MAERLAHALTRVEALTAGAAPAHHGAVLTLTARVLEHPTRPYIVCLLETVMPTEDGPVEVTLAAIMGLN